MTDSQLKYQQLMESQRHNFEMERLGQVEAESKMKQAEAALQQANTASKKLKSETALEIGNQAQGWTNMLWSRGNDTAKNFVNLIGSFLGSGFSKALFS